MTIKHGKIYTSEYQSWAMIKARCSNKPQKYYKNYAGRGITVCERWLSFENFLADMGNKPSSTHSIDRIDNDKGYSPDNCRWATKTEQSLNRRMQGNNTSGITGVHWDNNSKRWMASIRINGKKKGKTFPTKEEAISCRKQWEQERLALI